MKWDFTAVIVAVLVAVYLVLESSLGSENHSDSLQAVIAVALLGGALILQGARK